MLGVYAFCAAWEPMCRITACRASWVRLLIVTTFSAMWICVLWIYASRAIRKNFKSIFAFGAVGVDMHFIDAIFAIWCLMVFVYTF